jgi:membrane-associated phospholipid phosphatase
MRLRPLALTLIAAVWLFAFITEELLQPWGITSIDVEVAAYLHARATPSLSLVMVLISYFGSLAGTGAIAFATAIIFWRRKEYNRVLALSSAVPGGMFINGAVKYIVHRPRPVFENPITTLSSYSFPSGHAMAATVLYGLLAAFSLQTSKDLPQRTIAVAISGLLIALVCFSRLYLGLHYVTDVIAGIAQGLAWLTLCHTLVQMQQRRRALP